MLSKTEEILTQLQVKFESDLQKWEKDLEEKRNDLKMVSLEPGLYIYIIQPLLNQLDSCILVTWLNLTNQIAVF